MSKISDLRDEFAGIALGGILSNDRLREDYLHAPDAIAAIAYKCADAMLRARELKL